MYIKQALIYARFNADYLPFHYRPIPSIKTHLANTLVHHRLADSAVPSITLPISKLSSYPFIHLLYSD